MRPIGWPTPGEVAGRIAGISGAGAGAAVALAPGVGAGMVPPPRAAAGLGAPLRAGAASSALMSTETTGLELAGGTAATCGAVSVTDGAGADDAGAPPVAPAPAGVPVDSATDGAVPSAGGGGAAATLPEG